ncbi:hypothetical protein ACFL59_01910 [Planctomycetota bacterium]
MRRIDISRFLNTLDRTGKVFKVTFTGGGEPFLVPNLVETCVALTSAGHLVGFDTNLTSPRITDLVERIDPGMISYIAASAHLKELERKRLLRRFLRASQLCIGKGIPFAAREVAFPPLLSEVNRYRRAFADEGIDLTFMPYLGPNQGKLYPESYTEEELEIFGITKELGVHAVHQNLCNAGYNAVEVGTSGDVWTCHRLRRPLGHVYREIRFCSDLLRCPLRFCNCPLSVFDRRLYRRAKQELKVTPRSQPLRESL